MIYILDQTVHPQFQLKCYRWVDVTFSRLHSIWPFNHITDPWSVGKKKLQSELCVEFKCVVCIHWSCDLINEVWATAASQHMWSTLSTSVWFLSARVKFTNKLWIVWSDLDVKYWCVSSKVKVEALSVAFTHFIHFVISQSSNDNRAATFCT